DGAAWRRSVDGLPGRSSGGEGEARGSAFQQHLLRDLHRRAALGRIVAARSPRASSAEWELTSIRGEPADNAYARYASRAASEYGTGATVARISSCTCRSTVGFDEPPPSSPHTKVTGVPG